MIQEVIITNLTRPHAEAHNSYIDDIDDSYTCNTLHLLEPEEKCTYIKDTKACHELDVRFDYANFIFCDCEILQYREFCILTLILLCIIYALIICVTSYSSLAPNILSIIQHLKLSEFCGSIFAIAFSTCLTGVIKLRKRYRNDTEIIMSHVLTTNMLLRCFFTGLFLIQRPTTVHPFYYTRDQILYFAGLLITFSFIGVQTLDLVASIVGICLYGFIVIIAYLQDNLPIIKKHKESINAIHFRYLLAHTVVHPVEKAKLKVDVKQTLFRQFLDSIEPRRVQLAYRSNYWQKMILILGLPVNTIIALCIPVYNPLLPNNGWSKILNILNLFIFPLILLELFFPDAPIMITYVYFSLAIPFALYLLIGSSANKPPKFHIIFAYLGNLFCIGFLYLVETELISALTVLGYTFGLTRGDIGVYLLSISKSAATAVLAATLASWDYNRMALRILIFSPIVLTNLSVAVLVLVKCLEEKSNFVTVRSGIDGYTGIVFAIIEFFFTFGATILLNFHLRKCIGYYMIILFCIFILIIILSGTFFIHGWGTDHSIDNSYFRNNALWA